MVGDDMWILGCDRMLKMCVFCEIVGSVCWEMSVEV